MKKSILILSLIVYVAMQSSPVWARGGHNRNVNVNRNVSVNRNINVVGHGGYHHRHHDDVGAAVAAGVTGLAVGAMIGAATTPRTNTVVVQQPVVVPQPVVVQQVVVSQPAYGSMVYALPGGCAASVVNGTQYYKCNGIYHQPIMGSSGVYYQVVPPPF